MKDIVAWNVWDYGSENGDLFRIIEPQTLWSKTATGQGYLCTIAHHVSLARI